MKKKVSFEPIKNVFPNYKLLKNNQKLMNDFILELVLKKL
jgi:hypothetical protein